MNLHIIDDSTRNDHLFDPRFGRGFLTEGRPREGFAGSVAADPMPDALKIPPSEFQARIQEQDERESSLRHICDRLKIPSKDQQQTNYCWGNAPVYSFESLLAAMHQVYIALSAASICAPLTGYRNVGGWGVDALQRIADVGIVPESLWPRNAISSRYATAANFTVAARFRATRWLVPDDNAVYNQCISLLLNNIPVAVGYNWWGHEITWVKAVWLDGQAWPMCRNSWGPSYGDNGYFVLQGNRAMPSDACSPTLARAAASVAA